jgi:hypothetical protein
MLSFKSTTHANLNIKVKISFKFIGNLFIVLC